MQAAIKNKYGITSVLKEGHSGIFEVSINDDVVYTNVGVANNLPLAAAFATVPVAIMIVYLLIARRLGAFESL